ncbi:MAG: zinc metalloprotease HtpX [Chloroflexi bacterium]|nr:zinc metalloprotease HtpX [Chloroflexota bacterium]
MTMNGVKSAVLLGTLTGLLLLIGQLLGGNSGMLIALVLAAVMNIGSYWFSDSLALRMAGAREVTPEEAPQLHSIVEEVAYRAGVPKPRVAIMQSPQPNAFATGRNEHHAVVAATTGILQVLDREEMLAVIGHEIGHVKNRDVLISSIAATIAGAITMLAHMLQWGAMFGGFRGDDDEGAGGIVGLLATIILAPLAATIIQLAISRSREYGADVTGAKIVGDPLALASALQKIDAYSRGVPMNVNPAVSPLFISNPLGRVAMAGLFSTHPPIQERIKRLRRMAGYQE